MYKDFDDCELISFRQCLNVLSNYDIIIVQPRSFDSKSLLEAQGFSGEIIKLDDKWFKSVRTYNELMLQPSFYRQFNRYDYILIYQLDAYVFCDELQMWANKGYDYIGAPWMPNRTLFQNTIGKLLNRLKDRISPAEKVKVKDGKLRISHANIYFKSGNGGLSLRRVAKFIEITENKNNTSAIDRIIATFCMTEDVFFSIYMRKRAAMHIPHWKEAARFSIENIPEYLTKQIGGMPFGCHYWTKGKYADFWKPIIMGDKQP